MGMYDTISFGSGNTKVDKLKPGWQTKELYNMLYSFLIQDDQLFYVEQDPASTLHKCPLTKTFTIHNWNSFTSVMTELTLEFVDGNLESAKPGRAPKELPYIPAMERDAQRFVEGVEHTTAWLSEAVKRRPWHAKLRANVRAAWRELQESARYLKAAFKRLLGVY
jgi:hypothetical protein